MRITDAISSIPSIVEDAYEMLLNRNSNDLVERHEARKIVHIVVAARRPLSLKELDLAFQLATENPVSSYKKLDIDEKQLQNKIRNLCGLFVYINDKKVYMVHQTAKELLVAKATGSSSKAAHSWKHSFEETYSEMLLANVGIRYLLFTDFDEEAPGSWEPTESLRSAESFRSTESKVGPEYDCIDYCALNWASHFRKANVEEDDPLIKSNLMLCDVKSRRFGIWFTHFWRSERIPKWRPYRMSSLHIAAMNGHEIVLKQLLGTARADIVNTDSQDSSGSTPLHWAARYGHEGTVKILICRPDVDVNSRTNVRQTPLHLAASMKHKAIVKLLLEASKIYPDPRDSYDRTPLYQAAGSGQDVVVKLLVETGQIDVNAKNSIGQSPLSEAAVAGRTAVVNVLLDTGKIDFNARDIMGGTPLHWAARNGFTEVVKLLLDTDKVDINMHSYCDETPLHLAITERHITVAELLIYTNKVKVNVTNYEKRTALHLAARRKSIEIVRLLLSTGKVDVNLRDMRGWTARAWAIERGIGRLRSCLSPVRSFPRFMSTDRSTRCRAFHTYRVLHLI